MVVCFDLNIAPPPATGTHQYRLLVLLLLFQLRRKGEQVRRGEDTHCNSSHASPRTQLTAVRRRGANAWSGQTCSICALDGHGPDHREVYLEARLWSCNGRATTERFAAPSLSLPEKVFGLHMQSTV